ncbi:MAG: GDSL family lipase [Ferruginibacter sp.]|nr:GDSL family lipase [Ferruginibacter sp.]
MQWYEEEVKRIETEIAGLTHEPGIVFYGSSSIRLWESLEDDFQEYDPLNIGFGGSTLAACGWFFERLFANLNPHAIIVYAGDNDLGDGRSPEEVFLFFNELVHLIRQRFGDIPLGFISIKPSISRWDIVDKIRQTNRLIEAGIKKTGGNICYINIYDSMTDKAGYPKAEFLEPDGLHITEKGYQLWKDIILKYIINGNLNLLKR